MEKMINELVEKTGVDRATAEKVVAYLKDNASRIPELLGGAGGGVGGVAKSVINKVGDALGRHS
jgi:hypothetical protein